MKHMLPQLRARRLGHLLMAAIVLFLAGFGSARSTVLNDYGYIYGYNGVPTDMTGATQLTIATQDDDANTSVDIGFDFIFNGSKYTHYSASTNGLMGLFTSSGSKVYTSYTNNFGGSSTFPCLAAFWDDQHLGVTGGAIFAKVTGSAPNRVLTVEWRTRLYSGTVPAAPEYIYQVRLYETTNRFEFIYVSMTTAKSTSGSIGVASSTSDIVTLAPPSDLSNPPTLYSGSYNSVNLNGVTNLLPANAYYIGYPCERNIGIVGNIAQGASTTALANNADIFIGFNTQRGNSTTYQPFTINNGSAVKDACFTRTYTYTITGANASDYGISNSLVGPFNQSLSGSLTNLSTNTPYIRFTPSGSGVRAATLTVTDDNGFARTYNLKANGLTRVQYTANIPEGGTATMADQDTLLNGIRVDRLFFRDFQPFSITNSNLTPGTGNYDVVVTVIDPTDQYKLNNNGTLVNTTTVTLGPGQKTTPVLRFSPIGVGPQYAVMTVKTEDGTRTYTLGAYSRAAGADFFVGAEKLGPTSSLFQKDYLCSGESAVTIPITVKNVGEGTFRIYDFEAYETDSIYGQGVPKYPLHRDGAGNLVSAADYFLTEVPGMAPVTANPEPSYPLQTPEAGSTTIYLTFVPQMPGKRFTRLFINTNGANFSSVGPDGVVHEGVLALDLFGRGVGSAPSDMSTENHLPKPIAFKSTKVGDTVRRTIQIYNPGACDLRIGRKELRIVSGDAREFVIENAFSTAVVDQSNDTYIIPPGDSAAITFAFLPSRIGSRRATVRLQTNDSTIITNGQTERGSYYWDLFGTGSIGLEASRLSFRPAVIGDPEGGSTASTTIENTARELIRIDSMKIVGPNAAEFAMDPAKPWPATPFAFVPGTNLNFSVSYVPQPGTAPGIRQAQLLLFTSGGDTIVVELRAEAATRSLAVSPSSLFDGVTITVGKSARQTVMITNTGMTAVRLGTTTISGATAGDYILSQLPRLVLSPGQTEYLEVTYRPVGVGTSSGVLTVNSDATNGAQTVMLGGSGKRLDGAATPGTTSGVESESEDASMALRQSVPNPGHGIVEIGYRLAAVGGVDLRLFDATGVEVRILDSGVREPGEHSVLLDVSGLPSGTYRYRLTVDGRVLTRQLTVVK